jgi:hypothetical protein
LLQCASVDVPDLCSNRFEKALLPNINNDAKPRMVCSQEGEKGIECLHIKFTLAEAVFESRTTQKQGENAEYMFELRTTQMQERKNDEDITNMDTPTVVAYDSKVKLFYVYLIQVMNGRCTMICFQCHLQKYLHRSKKALIMHENDELSNTWIGDQIHVLPMLPPGLLPMATPGANIRVPPWPPPFTIRDGHGLLQFG